jgi:hypothetical protein
LIELGLALRLTVVDEPPVAGEPPPPLPPPPPLQLATSGHAALIARIAPRRRYEFAIRLVLMGGSVVEQR